MPLKIHEPSMAPKTTEGYGTKLKHVIHAALDHIPMPTATRSKIKSCGGCAKRERALNRVGEIVRERIQKSPDRD